MRFGGQRRNFMQGKQVGHIVKLFHNAKIRFAKQRRNFIGKKHAGRLVKFFARAENDLGNV